MSRVYDLPIDYRPLLNTREVETAIWAITDVHVLSAGWAAVFRGVGCSGSFGVR